MILSLINFFVCFAVAATAKVVPQIPLNDIGSPFTSDLDELITDTLDRYKVPGLSVAIVDAEQTYAKGYGIAQLPDIPITPETIFYGASTTKSFVAAALSLLVDDNVNYSNVKWTTPISELIRDDFVLEDKYSTAHITIEDALTHRTGLPRHDYSVNSGEQSIKETVRSLRYLPLTKPLRTTFQYCNLMYVTLGHVIEEVTGQWLGDFMADRVWGPLNMTSTYWSLLDVLTSGKQLARGQYWLTESQEFMEVGYVNETSTAGAGAVLSNVLDYSKWIRMMMNQDPPLSPAGHANIVFPRMVLGHSPETGSFETYAFGWTVSHYRGYEMINHNGGENGFGATVLYIPKKKWGCVMMSNVAFYSNVAQDQLIFHLVDDLLEVPLRERVNRTALYDAFLEDNAKLRNTTYAREQLYPTEQTGNVSMSLPLEKYLGSYFNEGYGPWEISYENGTLRNHIRRGPGFLNHDAELQHISGDHFLLIAYDPEEPEDPLYWKTEFIVGVAGTVDRLGLEFEESLPDQKIWFDRKVDS